MTFRFKRESGGPMPKPKIIDTADTMTSSKLSALKKAGVETIIRYDDRRPRGGWKQIHPAEAKLIRDAELRLGIVYEDAATASYFTRLEGILSASYARQQAAKRGQPDGSAEYFAVDFDPTSADVRNRIMPYFDGVYQAFEAERSSEIVCRRLLQRLVRDDAQGEASEYPDLDHLFA